MLLDLTLGPLTEPLTGRHWDRATVLERLRRRLGFYAELGLVPGDRVFLHFGNTPEFFVDLVAIWSLGGCAIPIDARLTAFEIATLAEAAAPRFSLWPGAPETQASRALAAAGIAVLDASRADAAAPCAAAPRGPLVGLDADALILFTSGTTGAPKGVVHTHRSLRARWMALHHALGIERYRRTLCLLPTHFGHGLICNSLFPWLSGQHLYIVPPFKADLILQLGALLDEHEITFMSSVPTVWRLALKTAAPPRRGSLQRVFCGSAPLSAHLWSEVGRWTGAREVWNAYGITETGSWLAGTSVDGFSPEDGLVGEAWGGVVRVLRTREAALQPTAADQCGAGETGHVWVNTPGLMRGYLGRDDLTEAVVSAGWFLTGDIGLVDDRGWLYLRGREREEINKGGMKVYPGDIDAVVERFADTVDVCTFAFDDALLGEEIGLAVVLRQADEATLRRLHGWMGEHLAKHQMPKRWYVVDEIPRTSRGKINRAAVAARCAVQPAVDLRGLLREPG
ncbi:MAG: class I adenylate-forming enzyme family protein [Candidatus Binatia bacterium]